MTYEFFFSIIRRPTRCSLLPGVQTCTLPIFLAPACRRPVAGTWTCRSRFARRCRPSRPDGCRGPVRAMPGSPCASDCHAGDRAIETRSEEHTSELQSLMRISYAVFCLKKKNRHTHEYLYIITNIRKIDKNDD